MHKSYVMFGMASTPHISVLLLHSKWSRFHVELELANKSLPCRVSITPLSELVHAMATLNINPEAVGHRFDLLRHLDSSHGESHTICNAYPKAHYPSMACHVRHL